MFFADMLMIFRCRYYARRCFSRDELCHAAVIMLMPPRFDAVLITPSDVILFDADDALRRRRHYFSLPFFYFFFDSRFDVARYIR